jgi:hypothetical protein
MFLVSGDESTSGRGDQNLIGSVPVRSVHSAIVECHCRHAQQVAMRLVDHFLRTDRSDENWVRR